MTAREMQIAFQDAFERADMELELTSTELFRELNEAQDDLIDRLFQRFEQDNVVTAALEPSVKRASIVPDSQTTGPLLTTTVDHAPLPADFRIPIGVSVQIEFLRAGNPTITGTNPRSIGDAGAETFYRLCKIAQHDDVHRLLEDPFNRSTFKHPLATFSESQVNVYCNDDFVCKAVTLDYLKDPDEIALAGPGGSPATVPSTFPDFLHREIVDMAVERHLNRASTIRSSNQPTSS